MMFTTEESGVRRYMGTITGISDLDPVRWKNSQWRNLQVSLAACTFHMIWWLCKLNCIMHSCVTIGHVLTESLKNYFLEACLSFVYRTQCLKTGSFSARP